MAAAGVVAGEIEEAVSIAAFADNVDDDDVCNDLCFDEGCGFISANAIACCRSVGHVTACSPELGACNTSKSSFIFIFIFMSCLIASDHIESKSVSSSVENPGSIASSKVN